MLSRIYIFVVLFVCYYIFSGINQPFFLVGGIIASLMGCALIKKMGLVAEYPKFNLRFVRYVFWLGKEIVYSTIDVVKQIWTRKLDLSSGFATIKTKQKTALGFTIFGNSITLTPGTVCVSVEDEKGEILIHSLTQKSRDDLHAGNMDSKVLEAIK